MSKKTKPTDPRLEGETPEEELTPDFARGKRTEAEKEHAKPDFARGKRGAEPESAEEGILEEPLEPAEPGEERPDFARGKRTGESEEERSDFARGQRKED